jgi:hypothetical protein
VFKRKKPANASDVLRQTAFGDVPLDAWPAPGAGHPGAPWDSFEQARQLVKAGRRDEAASIWQRIAATPGLESRHTLQAWHFLRQATGQPPPAEVASWVLGVAAEVPAGNGHDLLVAYRDGTARYLNYSGKAVVWENRSDAQIEAAITGWVSAGQRLANDIGVWESPALPPLPAGAARALMLTPCGHRFGQAPVDVLFGDPMAGAFLSAATHLMQLVTSRVNAA